MTSKLKSFVYAIAPAVLAVSFACGAHAADRVVLNRATIVVDADQPSYVQYGVSDMAEYLQESTGEAIVIVNSLEDAKGVRILVGTASVWQVFPSDIPAPELGEEGYLVQCALKDGTAYVLVTGSTPRGTKLALAVLMKAIRVDAETAYLPAEFDVLGAPAFAKRGMHLNGWPLNYPYSFRCWREEDWQRYLDMLAYQGVNLFYLWPFMEIMPVPLSPEDQAYLDECRRVVDYAQQKHGMEVWIMQCTNRVARDRCGVADPRLRPYWRDCQEDLDPGNPEHFKAILESREAMYRILDNVDGVCNIDSDPGFFPGSPQSDYVKVLQACRELLHKHNIHGREAKLINWMLWGWGREIKIHRDGLVEHQRLALRALQEGLPGQFWMISGQFPEFLPICRDEGLIAKTIYMPYGAIEHEPAYPGTNIRIDAIRAMYREPCATMPDLAGIMGNVQTPLLQFPGQFFFLAAAYDARYLDRPERDVLLEVSSHLFPEHKELLADGFLALKETDLAKTEALAGQLADLLRNGEFGRLGIFGRKLFPDHRIVADSLVLQLQLRAAEGRLLAQMAPTTPEADCHHLLFECLDAHLAWASAHGWHGLWGWDRWRLAGLSASAIVKKLVGRFQTEAEADALLARVGEKLSAKYDAAIVEAACIRPLKDAINEARNRRHQRSP